MTSSSGCGEQLAAGVTAAATALAQKYCDKDLRILASSFIMLGETLSLILTQRENSACECSKQR